MAERTVKLLENLLTWSRVQNGKLAVNYSEVSITDVLKENIELAERIALAKGLTLRLSPAGKIKIKADKEMITTVVRNLISNAIKFSSSGQTIYTGIKILTIISKFGYRMKELEFQRINWGPYFKSIHKSNEKGQMKNQVPD